MKNPDRPVGPALPALEPGDELDGGFDAWFEDEFDELESVGSLAMARSLR
ncbi:hypothetical protein [Lentzea flaviverrucosa]|nr:hypothetical protein [Lentzea flaviverrucosa]